MDICSTMWCMNPLNEPITEYGLKIADLRKKILFLKYIRYKYQLKSILK